MLNAAASLAVVLACVLSIPAPVPASPHKHNAVIVLWVYTSFWSSLFWLDKVGRDTRKCLFSFAAGRGVGGASVTIILIYWTFLKCLWHVFYSEKKKKKRKGKKGNKWSWTVSNQRHLIEELQMNILSVQGHSGCHSVFSKIPHVLGHRGCDRDPERMSACIAFNFDQSVCQVNMQSFTPYASKRVYTIGIAPESELLFEKRINDYLQ